MDASYHLACDTEDGQPREIVGICVGFGESVIRQDMWQHHDFPTVSRRDRAYQSQAEDSKVRLLDTKNPHQHWCGFT